ncbi:MAG: sensor domain-containing diguanylate cyclase [Christensenellaceae bacterium]|jgi:diguanylate cyclase (GGDEF)-like protein/PAS domain S-box-containing protein|nr:sensor domain-containing diguanylate cyclase [Christensenellaceae bacterium]
MAKKYKYLIFSQIIAILFAVCSFVIALISDPILSMLPAVSVVAMLVSFVFLIISYKSQFKTPVLDSLYDYMPGGNIEFYLDKNLTIRDCSPQFLRYVGIVGSDFMLAFSGSFLNMVVAENRERVLSELKRGFNISKHITLNCRIIVNGNNVIPVIIFASYRLRLKHSEDENTNSHVIVKCLVIDVSTVKELENKNNTEAERYRIIAEQSDAIVFEYNLIEKVLFLNSQFKRQFGYEVPSSTDLDVLFTQADSAVHSGDTHKLYAISRSLEVNNECEMRVRRLDNSFAWCKLTSTTLFGNDNKPARLIGKIIDIDDSVRESDRLYTEESSDPLTGAYSKELAQKKITEILENAQEGVMYALIVFNIDNFRYINANFGHFCGDRVLTKVVKDVSALFRSSDIIGRISGDEFVVLVKDLPSKNHAIKKTTSILSSIYNGFTLENDGFMITASAGVAFFPDHAKTHSELLDKASLAMIEAKHSGKNTYITYALKKAIKQDKVED